MTSTAVEIHNTRKEDIEKSGEGKNIHNGYPKKSCPCSTSQLLLIIIPLSVIALFAVIFIPVYIKSKDDDDDDDDVIKEEFDEFNENVVNVTYATLTPKNGYDNILIFLGGISDVSDKYFSFFKSENTFVPKGTKIYFLSGSPRVMTYMIDRYNYSYPVPGWFNVDSQGQLDPDEGYTEAKKSLNLVLDEIDRIKNVENVQYSNIYLSGFSQGGIMTNYLLLNSRKELGGYIAFSGYVFDHDFPSNTLAIPITETQKSKLDSKKDYHILATHSFNDEAVPYNSAAPSYSYYYKDYTDFKLLSFGYLTHVLPEQPIHPIVKRWLEESMGK